MARDMKFERETVYRAAILYLYTSKDDYMVQNPDKYPVKQYVLDDGTVIHYNYAKAYGPYSTPAPAKTQCKAESKAWGQKDGRWQHYQDPNVVATLVEKTEIDWEEHLRLS